jgi:hypothetical protein
MAFLITCPTCGELTVAQANGALTPHSKCKRKNITSKQYTDAVAKIKESLAYGKANPAGKLPKTKPQISAEQISLAKKRTVSTAGTKNLSSKDRDRIEKEQIAQFQARQALIKSNRHKADKLRKELDSELKPLRHPGVTSIVSGGLPSIGKKK